MHPFQNIESFLWEDRPHYQTSFQVDLYTYKRNYDIFYTKLREAELQILDIEHQLKILEDSLVALDNKRNSEIDNNFRLYDEKKLKPFRNTEEAIQVQLDILEKKLPKEITTEADLDILKELGKKRVELAQAKSKTANQAYLNSENLLQNLAGFMSNETWDEYRKASDTKKKLFQKRYDYENIISETRRKAIDALRDDIQLVRSRVSFVDFAFFSIGISTTTTFGDLVANDYLTKLLVSIQLLTCLVIISIFLGAVIKMYKLG